MNPIPIRNGLQQARWLVSLLAVLAGVVLCIAVHELIVPSSPPFKGRLSWLGEMVFHLAGSPGLAFMWLLLAAALLLVARFVWRHTPKKPSDGWLV